MRELTICHLYPDLLNLYGDRGNIISLARRAQWRGMNVNIINVTMGEAFIPEDYDIIFLGGGQDYEQQIIQKDVIEQKGTEIKNAINNDKVFLCICGGYQLLGNYYKTWDGKELEFLGAIDLWTVGHKERNIGNIIFQCDILKNENTDGFVVGFENHSGKTYLGNSVAPLGKVIYGSGNNGEDGYEGAIYKNVICSYSHGSLLPKNPALSDYLINKALSQKYEDFAGLEPLDDSFELAAQKSLITRFVK